MVNILGLSCYGHDASAALVIDGELRGFVEEERFTREKHTAKFPEHAIHWCCQRVGIEPRRLDHVIFYWNPYLGLVRRLIHVGRYFPRSLELVRSRGDQFAAMLRLKRTLRRELGLDRARTAIHFVEHHVAHAASTFLTSPWERAAVLSLDAVGEWSSAWLGRGDGTRLDRVGRVDFPHSLGLVYGAITEHLGFDFADGEGKVMALAAYGDPDRYLATFREILASTGSGGFRVDTSYFSYHTRGRPHWVSDKLRGALGPPRPREGEIEPRHLDIAAALQSRLEEVVLDVARWLRGEVGLASLCLAGGIFLNSVLVGRLQRDGPFDEIWVPPSVHDAGTSVGACYWLWNTRLGHSRARPWRDPYLGPSYDDARIVAAANEFGLTPERVDDAPDRAAECLAAKRIVAWFDGRMECGARALGNRSILAHPGDARTRDLVNSRVKFREWFRPFAPSVLAERFGDYFEGAPPTPFMSGVSRVREGAQETIPAVTHIDGTARVHALERDENPRFHDLIRCFGERSGIFCVLNTSFNRRGEPIVNTPEEAIRCFLETDIDVLFLGNHQLSKDRTPVDPGDSASEDRR